MELTKSEVERVYDIDTRRRKLQREVDALEREAEPLKKRVRAYIEAQGGSDRTCVHYGFILALKSRAGTVGWKNEFIEVAGPDAAMKLQEKAPPSFVLSIEPTGQPTPH